MLHFRGGALALRLVFRFRGSQAFAARSHANFGFGALTGARKIVAALFGAGVVNVALYEFLARREVDKLPPGAIMPAHARAAGVLSLVIWVAVAACGRSIAYF